MGFTVDAMETPGMEITQITWIFLQVVHADVSFSEGEDISYKLYQTIVENDLFI